MPQPTRVQAILAKNESTYGTDASPTAGSDEIQVEENFWNSISHSFLEENRRGQAHSTFGRAGGQSPPSVGEFADLDLVVPIKGRSSAFAAANRPEMDVLLRACAFSASVDTTSGSEKVTYTLTDSGFESATIYAYAGNKEFKLLGCIGTVRFDLTPGQIARARFTLSGLVSAISEAGLPGSLAFPAKSVPPITVKGAGLTLNAFDPDDFTAFELDVAVEVAERPGGNASDGHAGYWPANWDPQISTTYEVPALSTHNPWDLRSKKTEFAWDIGSFGPSQYNKFKLSGPAGCIVDLPPAESNGLAYVDPTIDCRNTDPTTADAVAAEFS